LGRRQEKCLRKEPIKYTIEKIQVEKKEKSNKKKEEVVWEEDEKVEKMESTIEENKIVEEEKEIVKEDKKVENSPNVNEKIEETKNDEFEDNDDWITMENLEKKLHTNTLLDEEEKDENKEKIFIVTTDFAVQNLALKIGILINSIDGIRVRTIRNYILKCYSCSTFNFDTSRLFCEFCGYTTLMKIGYSVSFDGTVLIRDKDPDPRLRGKQFNIPNPSLDKKGKIYLLSEDQLPKRKLNINMEKDFDKLIDNYFQYKDLLVKNNDVKPYNSSKNFVWGYPKKNPNEAKKYYSKKSKK